MILLRPNIHTEQDYFDALEVLYEAYERNNQARFLFNLLLKLYPRFEKRRRQELWQHLRWTN